MSYKRWVDVRIWGRESYRGLSKPEPNGRDLFLFLILGPHTEGLPGLYTLGRAALAESIEWDHDVDGLDQAMQELDATGLAHADWRARVVMLPGGIDNNPPESPDNVLGWRERFDIIPQCDLKQQWARLLCQHIRGRREAQDAYLAENPPKEGSRKHKPWEVPAWLADAAGEPTLQQPVAGPQGSADQRTPGATPRPTRGAYRGATPRAHPRHDLEYEYEKEKEEEHEKELKPGTALILPTAPSASAPSMGFDGSTAAQPRERKRDYAKACVRDREEQQRASAAQGRRGGELSPASALLATVLVQPARDGPE